MSGAVLRMRPPNEGIERDLYRPKARAQDIEAQAALRAYSEVEMPSAYIEFISTKNSVVVEDANRQDDYMLKYNWKLTAAAVAVGGIIILGMVVGYLDPGPLTGAILPFGFAMWWLLYRIADYIDRRG